MPIKTVPNYSSILTGSLKCYVKCYVLTVKVRMPAEFVELLPPMMQSANPAKTVCSGKPYTRTIGEKKYVRKMLNDMTDEIFQFDLGSL